MVAGGAEDGRKTVTAIRTIGLAGLALATLVPAAAAATGGESASGRMWVARRGWQPLAGPAAPPAETWTREIAPFDDRHAYLAEGALLVTGESDESGTSVTRIDVANGDDLWTVERPDVTGEFQLGTASDRLITLRTAGSATGEAVTVLAAEDGSTVWSGEVDSPLQVATDELLLLGGIAIDLSSGAERWRRDDLLLDVSGSAITFETSLLTGDEATFGIVDPATGDELWTQPRPEYSDVAVLDDVVVRTEDRPGDLDGATGYDASSGEVLWQADLPPVGRANTTLISDDLALVAPGGGGQGAAVVDVHTGDVMWTTRTVESARGYEYDGVPIVVATIDGATSVLDGATGEVRIEVSADQAALAPSGLVATDGSAVLGSDVTNGDEQWRIVLAADDIFRAGNLFDGGFWTIRNEYDTPTLIGYTDT